MTKKFKETWKKMNTPVEKWNSTLGNDCPDCQFERQNYQVQFCVYHWNHGGKELDEAERARIDARDAKRSMEKFMEMHKDIDQNSPDFLKELDEFKRTLGIAGAGPLPQSLLSAQDLEGTQKCANCGQPFEKCGCKSMNKSDRSGYTVLQNEVEWIAFDQHSGVYIKRPRTGGYSEAELFELLDDAVSEERGRAERGEPIPSSFKNMNKSERKREDVHSSSSGWYYDCHECSDSPGGFATEQEARMAQKRHWDSGHKVEKGQVLRMFADEITVGTTIHHFGQDKLVRVTKIEVREEGGRPIYWITTEGGPSLPHDADAQFDVVLGKSMEKATATGFASQKVEDELLYQHLAEINRKGADAWNIGSYTDDTTIYSKTDKGGLESRINIETLRVSHLWDSMKSMEKATPKFKEGQRVQIIPEMEPDGGKLGTVSRINNSGSGVVGYKVNLDDGESDTFGEDELIAKGTFNKGEIKVGDRIKTEQGDSGFVQDIRDDGTLVIGNSPSDYKTNTHVREGDVETVNGQPYDIRKMTKMQIKVGDVVDVPFMDTHVTGVVVKIVDDQVYVSYKTEMGIARVESFYSDELHKGAVETTGKQLERAVDEASNETVEPSELVDRIKNIQLKRQKATITARAKSSTKTLKQILKGKIKKDSDDEGDQFSCPMCGGADVEMMGALGTRSGMRCRACGWVWTE